MRKPHDFQSPLQGIFSYTKQLFLYAIIGVIGGDLMNAYLRIKEYNDSYTATEKLIAEYILENDILQDSAQALGEKTNTSAAAIIRFSKKIGFKGFSDLKMNLAQSTKEEKQQEVDLIFEPEDNISTLVEKGCRLNMNTVLKTYQLTLSL